MNPPLDIVEKAATNAVIIDWVSRLENDQPAPSQSDWHWKGQRQTISAALFQPPTHLFKSIQRPKGKGWNVKLKSPIKKKPHSMCLIFHQFFFQNSCSFFSFFFVLYYDCTAVN